MSDGEHIQREKSRDLKAQWAQSQEIRLNDNSGWTADHTTVAKKGWARHETSPVKEGWERGERREGFEVKASEFETFEGESNKTFEDLKEVDTFQLRSIERVQKLGYENAHQISRSGKNWESCDFKKDERLYKFTSHGYDQRESPYWLKKGEFESLKNDFDARHFENVKQRVAVPCVNRCDAYVVAEVQRDCTGLKSEVNPAKENLFYRDAEGREYHHYDKQMQGGSEQVTPPYEPDPASNSQDGAKRAPNRHLKIVERHSAS